MSDEPEIIGDNQSADLKGRVDTISSILDEIDDAKLRLKEAKDSAKADGYNLKVVNQIVKEKRKGAEFQADQLALEAELNQGRKAIGLPTEIEEAQKLARVAAEQNPDEKKEKRKKKKPDNVVKFNNKMN